MAQILTYEEIGALATCTANHIKHLIPDARKVYAIPRGGVPAAWIIAQKHGLLTLVDNPVDADIFIDDIIDSGATMEKWCDDYPERPFFALIDQEAKKKLFNDEWIVFPWENGVESGPEDNIRRLLQFVGEDPTREGLGETPVRVVKAWKHWCSGYGGDLSKVLKVFEDGAENYDQMVLVKDIPFYSHCEHHMAPFFGTVTIAYIPDGKIVGLSKLPRLVGLFSRRLQVQERLTTQIAAALEENLKPKGVGVIVKARHLCMESRGICQQGHHTVTSALRGVLMDKPEARAEFMELTK